ncbi:MAG: class II aldolase/adducin family protein [Brevinemataceae bacterium]
MSYATTWAQSDLDIPIQGTTHADYFYGDVPCLSVLSQAEVEESYEHYTGIKIVSEFEKKSLNPEEIGACLLTGHGPFTWGATVDKAVENSIVLEAIAQMGFHTLYLNKEIKLPQYILDKHYLRKHGKNAYYGQK